MSQLKRSSKRSSKRRRKFKNKVSNFSKAVGLSPLRIFLSVTLLSGVVFFICFIGFSESSLSRRAAAASPLDFRSQQEKVNERLKVLLKQKLTHANNFLLSIDQIQECETEISDIEASHSLTPSQEERIALTRLKNKGATVLQMLRNDIGYDNEKADLFRFCDSYEDQGQSEIRYACRYWLCAVPTLEFAYAPSPKTLVAFTTAIEEYEDCYLDFPKHAERLGQILTTMISKNRKTSELTRKGLRNISQRMLKSKTKRVRYAGEKLILLEIFGEFDLTTLGYRIAWNAPSAEADMEGAISALEANVKIAPVLVWDVIISAYESYLSSAHVDKVGTAWQRMWTLSEQIASEGSKKQVQIKLLRQKHRATSVGSTFDLSGFRLKGGAPLNLNSHEYIAIVFYDEGKGSLDLIRKIVTTGRLKHPNVHFVLAYKESYAGKALQMIDDSHSNFTIVDESTARKYYEELLVDITPYITLVDRSGEILGTSLPFDQLETRVARIKIGRSESVTTVPQS